MIIEDEALIIPIRGTTIYWLDPHHLENNLNVTLVAQNGQKIQVNHLQMASLTPGLLSAQDFFEQDSSVITTNLELSDLTMVANFISYGILPLSQEELQKSIPEPIAETFHSFGINLGNLLNNVPLKLEPTSEIKKEFLNVKIEEGGEHLDLDQIQLEPFFDEDDQEQPAENIPVSRKRGRPAKRSAARKAESESDDIDEDWIPMRRPRKSEIIADTKPRKKRQPNSNSNLSRYERDLKVQCEKFLEDYKEFANLSIPNEANPESKALETYHLPNGIESYKTQPKKIERINTKQDALHPYPCQECEAWFNSPYVLKNHVLLYHSEHYQCPQCKYAAHLDQIEEFRLHMFRHESRKHECIHCGTTFCSLKSLESHFKNEGPYHNNQCTTCHTRLTSHQEYREHVQTVHQGHWVYICGICDVKFSEKREHKEHRLKVHKKLNSKSVSSNGSNLKMCDLCGKEVASLATHHKVHHQTDEQTCQECGKICKTKYHLDDHIKGTHSRVPCEICGLMIPIRRKERHIQQAHVNPEDRKYKCDHCGKGFTDRQKLNDHINTHTGERPYVCKFCGKGFANHGNQRAHIRQAHLGQKRNYKK